MNPSHVKTKGYPKFMKMLQYRQAVCHEIVADNLRATKEFLIAKDKKFAKEVTFTVGQKVYLFTPRLDKKYGNCKKLAIRWTGPMIIARRISDHLYILKNRMGGVGWMEWGMGGVREGCPPCCLGKTEWFSSSEFLSTFCSRP